MRVALLSAFAALVAYAAPSSAGQASSNLLSGSLITHAGAADQAKLCPSGTGYPREFTYAGSHNRPVSAAAGQPRIEQVRQGQVIAVYQSFADGPNCTQAGDGTDYLNPAAPASSGCGPFTRTHSWRLWAPGDTFLVYPAVYTGDQNQPWFGPTYDDPADYSANIFHTPDNVVIQGVVQNNTRPVIVLNAGASNNTLGQAPVYVGEASGLVIDSLNIEAGSGAQAGKAGLYADYASNLTLRNMRISGFERSGVNGLFVTADATGQLTLDGVELDHNGGPNGPAHNAYINASLTDPNFTVAMTNSWSHDAFYGHLFKTRAQNGVFTANFFQGGRPTGRHTQAENYLLDIPNGGRVTVRNNIFVKNQSGPNSNAMSLTFLVEGANDGRTQSADIENNTFVTFAKTYNGGSLIYPMAFLYPSIRPDSAAFPAGVATRIIKNAFIGYCTPGTGGVQDYRGDIDVTEGFSELTSLYALLTKISSDDSSLFSIYPNYVPEVGTASHAVPPPVPGVRQTATIGAQD